MVLDVSRTKMQVDYKSRLPENFGRPSSSHILNSITNYFVAEDFNFKKSVTHEFRSETNIFLYFCHS